MRKVLSLLLCVLLCCTMLFVPLTVSAETGDVQIKNSIGRYYRFSFGEGEDRFDYNSQWNKPLTYKGNSFYPFMTNSDRNTVSEATYTTLADGSQNGLPVLQLKAPALTYLTPLTALGKPFEVEPGKIYAAHIDMYVEVEVNYAQMGLYFCGVNQRPSINSENYSNASAVRVHSTEGAAKVSDISMTGNNYTTRPYGSLGFAVNNGDSWAHRVYGDTTATAHHIDKTYYFAIPQSGTNGMSAVYDPLNDAISFCIPEYTDKALSTVKDSDKDGVGDIGVHNNYFYLYMSGGNYVDSAGTSRPMTYDLVSLEVWENGYAPEVDFVVNGETVKNVDGSQRSHLPYFIPEAEPGRIFSGWYEDEACTRLVDTATPLVPGVTKLYAGFREKRDSLHFETADNQLLENRIYLPTLLATDATAYRNYALRGGWSYAGYSTGDRYIEFSLVTPWGGGGSYLVSDEEGYAFIAEPNATYDVTLEYKVNDIITSQEVGELPDGSTYDDGYVRLSVGVGMPLQKRTSPDNTLPHIYNKEDNITHTEPTDWLTAQYTLTTDDLIGQMPVFVIYVNAAGLPRRYSGTTQLGEPGDASFGLNQMFIRKIVITKHPQVSVTDQFGHTLADFSTISGCHEDLTAYLKPGEYAFGNGTGYTANGFRLYADAAHTVELKASDVAVDEEHCTFYAVADMAVDYDANQVSYESFEGTTLPSYTRVSGVAGGHALCGVGSTSPADLSATALENGSVYHVAFLYKASAGAVITVGDRVLELPETTEFTRFDTAVTAGTQGIPFCVNNGTVTVDCVGIYRVLYDGGRSILNEEAESLAGRQAMRTFFGYATADGSTLNVAGQQYPVAARGVVVMSAATGEQTVALDTVGATVLSKTDRLDDCWSGDADALTFSYYFVGFGKNDARKLLMRGFVQTDNGTVYYGTPIITSVAEIKEMNLVMHTTQTYSFTDPDLLDLVKIEGAYDVLTTGITFDWTGNSLVFDAYCHGDVEIGMSYSERVSDQYYALFVDGVRAKDNLVPVATTVGDTTTYSLRFSIPVFGKHHVVVSRCAEGSYGGSMMKTMTLTGKLLKCEDNKLLIEFIGDSITCGLGNLGSESSIHSDGTKAYAYLTANALGTDWRIRSMSGIGFRYNSGGDKGLKKSWDASYPIENMFRSTTRAYTQDREADIVCIYLGTNDCFYGYSKAGDSISANGVADMKALVGIIKEYNPNAKIVWVGGGMTTSYLSYAQTAMKQLGGEEAGYYVAQLTSGLNGGAAGHPTAEQHLILCDDLTKFLRNKGLVD